MDAITKVEGTLSGLSVHLGTGLKAVGWAQQKFEQLQREFVGLKAELKKARGDLERSEAWNERLREQLQAEGIEIMDTGEIDYGLVDGETATETPDAVRLQNAFTGLDQPPPPCNRCAHLGDASLAAAASYTNPGPPPDDRKPVCVYCWQTGSTCDREPQCQSCVEEERTCVHKLCDGGARCTRRGCMRLHPVQWDRCDPRWTVEEGRMPEQGVVVKEEDRGT